MKTTRIVLLFVALLITGTEALVFANDTRLVAVPQDSQLAGVSLAGR